MRSPLELLFIALESMLICSAPRVARRYLSSKIRTAVVAHVDALGNLWGWFANDIPRMHLVPLAPEHRGVARVWLEIRGVRCFEVYHAQSNPGIDLAELRESVRRTRDSIESAWLRSCERKGWLAYSPRDAMVALYFATPHQFVRRLRDSTFAPEYLHLDVATNAVCLETRANRLIWFGADDGSDAGSIALSARSLQR